MSDENKSFYVVWNPEHGIPMYRRHPDVRAATEEATRLCQMPGNIGKEFFVLRAVESVKYNVNPLVHRTFSRKG